MDGSFRERLLRGAAPIVVLVGLSGGLTHAQVPATGAASSATADLAAALERTRVQAVPTVVVATSLSNPQSKTFFREISEGAWARQNRGLVQVVELPADSNPNLANSLQIRTTPTIVACVAGPEGVSCRGRKSGGTSAEAAAWLESLQLVGPPRSATMIDPSLAQASFDSGYPSAQKSMPQAAPPITPSSNPVSVPTPTPAAPIFQQSVAPQAMMMVPTALASTLVQMPSQDIVVQQAQPRVFFAPQPAATMMAQPTGMVFAPQPAMAAFAQQPVAPAANMFLPVSAPAATAAVANVAPAMANVPVANVPVGVANVPVGNVAPAAGFAVTNQTVGLSTAGTFNRTRVRGPGPIRFALSRLGERMVELGRTRIETVQETILNTPQSLGGGGQATFSTSSATPVGVPQSQSFSFPQSAPPPPPPPPISPQSEVPTPSPQAVPTKHGHFLRRN